MSLTWHDPDSPPDWPKIGPLGWVLVVLRGSLLAVVIYSGLLVSLALRLIEKPLFGARRPWTPLITQVVCRISLLILGLGFRTTGQPLRARGAVVANHVGWIDILTLNAAQRVYFVSKADVASWPGIGMLARATGTLFIERKSSEAAAQKALLESRLSEGHKLLFFPEGTSTDGIRVLPFKSTLFAAFFSPELKDFLQIQPVSAVYEAPKGQDKRFYGWWGEMDFGRHLLQVLAAPRQGRVTIHFHDPVKVSDFPDRKALSAYCEAEIRSSFR